MNQTNRLDARSLNTGDVLLVKVVKVILVDFLLDLSHGDVGNSLVTVEDTGDLLESGSLGLRVDEVDEDEFDADPALSLMLAIVFNMRLFE